MAEGLFVFEKRGIEKIELERSMKHTIRNFKVCGLNHDEQSQLQRECEKRINCICKSVCIREVFRDGTLDERKRKVNDIFSGLKLTVFNEETNRTDGASIVQQHTTGQQGIEQHRKIVHTIYKKAFKTLFDGHDYLIEKYSIMDNGNLWNKPIPAQGILRDIRNPWELLPDLYDIAEPFELTTEDFCVVVINEMTTKWARELIRLNHPDQFSESQRNQLKADFKNAYTALAGRFAMEMIIGNNLLKEPNVWAEHVKVIIALSVYLSVLESVFHKIRGCGYEELADILQ